MDEQKQEAGPVMPVTKTVPQQPHSKYRKPLLVGLITTMVIVGIAVFFYWLLIGRFKQFTDDAYVAGNMVDLMPLVSGTVVAIKADNTDLVLQNQPVVLLNDTDNRIALANAKANLAATVRQVRELYENADQLRANIAVQEAQYVNAEQDLNRRQGSFKGGAVSLEDLQHAQTAMNVATSTLNLVRHQYAAAYALVENTDLLNYPTLKQAEASLRQAYLNNERTVIRSPVSGFVAKRNVQVGQQVAPGQALLSIIPLNQIWVEANYKEVQLSDVRIGQPATFTADIYGSKVVYHGKVIGIGAGTGSVFSLLPPQNATGNWIKIVQRLPVKISIDPQELIAHPLRIGLSTRVTINIRQTTGKSLATSTSSNTEYQTPIYLNEEQGAEQLIQAIIKANAGASIPSAPADLPLPSSSPRNARTAP